MSADWCVRSADELVRAKDAWLVYLTPPHAPSLLTTVAPNGSINVGAFEQTMLCSNVPPVISLAILPECDTALNILDSHESVVGFPWPSAAQAVHDAGMRLPRGESELSLIEGLSSVPSHRVRPPRLLECWLSLETRLVNHLSGGDHEIFLLEVIEMVVSSDVWSPGRVVPRYNLPSLYYATAGRFFLAGEQVQVDTYARYQPGLV